MKIKIQEKAPNQPKDASLIDPELKRRVRDAMIYPISGKDPFWQLEPLVTDPKEHRRIFGLISKRKYKDDQAKILRESITQSPGNTLIKIKKLKKKYPDSGILMFISGICSYEAALNAGDKADAISGMKTAVREAGIGLMSDQISLNNIEMFLKIYFGYLDRLKREQIAAYDELIREPLLDSYRRDFLNTMQITELLYGERKSIQRIIIQLKKRIKSSMVNTLFEDQMIRESINNILKSKPKEKNRMGTAGEYVAFFHAIISIFAHIPVMSPFVDKLLGYFPESHKDFLLRKISISSTRNFIRYRIAAAEGNMEQMSQIGKIILRENSAAVGKVESQSLNHAFETDPFFNIAFLAELSHGLYSEAFHQDVLNLAMGYMNEVIGRDMSRNHAFTELATKMLNKLGVMKAAAPEPENSPKAQRPK